MRKKTMSMLAIAGAAGVVTVAGVGLASGPAYANDSVVDEINITVPVSCTMTGTGMNSHTAEINNGTVNSSIDETTIKAFCNDSNGFAIYAIGYTDNEEGKNVLTSSTLDSTYDIATGTATSGNTSNWAMKLSTISSPAPTYPIIIAGSNEDTLKQQDNPDYSTFQEVPDDYVKVAYRTSNTDIGTNAEGSTLKTTYQAYISSTQPAGTYSGQVKYTLVHPHTAPKPFVPHEVECEANTICYQANTNVATGSMGSQALYSADKKDWSSCRFTDYASYCQNQFGGSIDISSLPTYDYYIKTLYASNYARDGYGFAGWNDRYDYSGNFYGPNQTINITEETAANGLTLYAVWVESAGTFQDSNTVSTVCNNLTSVNYNSQNETLVASLSSVSALTDNRNNQTYAIAKLADGKCWMIENLRLDDTAELSTTNTNNPALPLTNDNGSSSNRLSATSSSWCTGGVDCINQSKLDTSNTMLYQDNTTSNQTGYIYSYGNYYNWYSATAGQGISSVTSVNGIGDICPNNWHLPSDGAGGDFGVVDIAMGGNPSYYTTTATHENLWRSFPNNIVYSSNERKGTDGHYTSSTAGEGIHFSGKTVNVEWGGNRYSRLSVRCLFAGQ